MGRFRNTETGVVVTVADAKDDRFGSGAWESIADDGEAEAKVPAKKAAERKPAAKKSE